MKSDNDLDMEGTQINVAKSFVNMIMFPHFASIIIAYMTLVNLIIQPKGYPFWPLMVRLRHGVDNTTIGCLGMLEEMFGGVLLGVF